MASSVIGALRVNLGLDSAQFNRGAKQAQTTTQRLGKSLQKIGAAASAVGAGVALAVRGQLNAADQLGKSAQQLGLPVEQLSQLQHAANLSGVSMSSLETGLRRLSQNMAQDADKFAALGIAVRDANGEMRPTADVMADLSNVLADMPDGAEKTALAMDLMGRSGAEMIPLLNGGADALRDMMAEADALGLTITSETADAAAQFNDNLARLTGTMKGWVTLITAELAPVLARVTDAIVAASERFQGMSPIMRQVAAAIAGITVVAGPVILGLGTLLVAGKAIIAPFTGIAALFGGAVKIAFAGLAAVIATVGLPITLLVAGVAALTAVVVKFWPEIKQATAAIAEWALGLVGIEGGIDGAKQALARFTADMIRFGIEGVEFVKGKLRELVAFLRDLPAQMRQAGADLMNGLVEGVTSGASRARDAVGNAARGLIDRFRRETDTRSPSQVFKRLGGYLMDGLVVGIEERDHVATAAMAGVTDKLKDQVGDAASQISGMFETAFVGIVTGSMKAREAIGRLLQDLARLMAQRAFQSLFGGAFGGGGLLGGLFGGFRADGGPVSAGRSYLVGERGPELFTPGASGQITSNENMRGGGQLVIRLDLSQDVEARIMQNTSAQSVQIVRTETPRMIGSAFSRAQENRAFD